MYVFFFLFFFHIYQVEKVAQWHDFAIQPDMFKCYVLFLFFRHVTTLLAWLIYPPRDQRIKCDCK